MLMSESKQKQLVWVCFACYMSVYLAKLNYNALMVEIIDALGTTKAAAGLVGTFFFAAYGIFQFVHAAFIKRYNLRYVVFGAMLCSGLCNVLMALVGDINIMKYIWFVNGIATSFLWCSMFGEMAKYLNLKISRYSIIVMGLTTPIGTALNYLLCATVTAFATWKLSFYIACAVMTGSGLLWLFFIGDIEKKYVTSEVAEKRSDSTEKKKATKAIFVCLGVFFLASAFIQFIRDGITSWVPTMLYDLYALPKTLAITLTLGLPLVGVLSNITVVTLEKVIKNFTVFYLMFTGGMVVCLGTLMMVYGLKNVVLTMFLFVLAAFMGAGVGAIVTSHIPVYYKGYFNAGSLAGFSNGSAYVGSMFSTYTLGLVADNGGWDAVFKTLVGFACVAFAMILVLYIFQKITKDRSSIIN